MKKACRRCGKTKPLSEYHKNSARLDGVQTLCKPCNCMYQHEWYIANKVAHIKRVAKWTWEQRGKNAEVVMGYLITHPCVDCGETDPVVLEFDHVKGNKRMDISKMAGSGYSVAALMGEISKCDVRCANCHRRKTFSGIKPPSGGRCLKLIYNQLRQISA